jgi:hypothetical protein
MDFRFRTSLTGELVNQEKNFGDTNLLGYKYVAIAKNRLLTFGMVFEKND